MQRDLCAYLQDILDAADSIQLFVGGLSFETFDQVDLILSAVERKFEIIGEALNQASKYFPASVDSVPELKGIIGQRNRIAHGYFAVDPIILWKSIEEDLPKLIKEVERLKAVSCP